NSLLEFARVVKAQEQVVAGTLHHLTIEAVDAGKKKLYEAKVAENSAKFDMLLNLKRGEKEEKFKVE
ncbi:hypothetical protein CRG98_048143, partial [Punica granatum]